MRRTTLDLRYPPNVAEEPLFQDAQLTILHVGDWIRILPVGRVLDYESKRAGANYRSIDIPLQRLAGVSCMLRDGAQWWLRFTGCFHGLYDFGTQEGTLVDVGPLKQDTAVNASAAIRETVPMPLLEEVASLREVLGKRHHLWLTIVTTWPSDLDGVQVRFPRNNAPPDEAHGTTLSIRGLLEDHGPDQHVLHVMSWTPVDTAAQKEAIGLYSTLVSSPEIPIASLEQQAFRATAAHDSVPPPFAPTSRPFDRFVDGSRLDVALSSFPHGAVKQIGEDRWQVEDADLGGGLRGTAVLVCKPGLTRVEQTIPLGADLPEAISAATFAVAHLSVYGLLTPDRLGGPTDPVVILRSLVSRPRGPDGAATVSLMFVDIHNPQLQVPLQIRYVPASTKPSWVFQARVSWVFSLRHG